MINQERVKTVLIVDDDRSILKSMKRAAELQGYKVMTAASLEETKKYAKQAFNVAIIDGLDGKCFAVYKLVKAARKVILTGEDSYIQTAKEQGIEAYEKLTPLEDILK